jgi:hypothetical protein
LSKTAGSKFLLHNDRRPLFYVGRSVQPNLP